MATAPAMKKPAPAEKTSKIAAPAKAPVAKAAPAAEAAEGTEAAEATPKVGRSKFQKDHVITLLVDYNPKRVGSSAHASFSCYEDGMTVEEFLAAGGLSVSLPWDTAHGFIEIGPEFNDKAVKASKPVKEPKPAKEPKAEATEGAAKPKAKAPAKAKAAVEDEPEDPDAE